MKPALVIGYSGHSYVIIDILTSQEISVKGYCESEHKSFNPYDLEFYGSEMSEEGLNALTTHDYFIAIGSNGIRAKVQNKLYEKGIQDPLNAIHSSAILGSHVELGKGIMICQGAIINAHAKIGNGTICNTGSAIEHEVEIGTYCFIAPNSTLLGGVKIGNNCFIGANSVVLQNVTIGDNSIIGAGTVVLKDVPPNSKVVGNPQRFI